MPPPLRVYVRRNQMTPPASSLPAPPTLPDTPSLPDVSSPVPTPHLRRSSRSHVTEGVNKDRALRKAALCIIRLVQVVTKTKLYQCVVPELKKLCPAEMEMAADTDTDTGTERQQLEKPRKRNGLASGRREGKGWKQRNDSHGRRHESANNRRISLSQEKNLKKCALFERSTRP